MPFMGDFLFYVSLHFYNVFVSPRQVQIFTPVKDTGFCSRYWKRESKGFTFIVLPKRGEEQNDTSEYAADDRLLTLTLQTTQLADFQQGFQAESVFAANRG